MPTIDTTNPLLQKLKANLQEISDLQATASLLHWDQATYMPSGGATARGRQLAILKQIAHEKFINPEIGELLDKLREYEASLPEESDNASLLRITRRDYEKATNVPAKFMAEFSRHSAQSYKTWIQAKAENNFAAVVPYLEKTLEMSQEYAQFFPGYEHIADPLIDVADYGVKVTQLRQLFNQLRDKLVPIVEAICSQQNADDSFLHQHFPQQQQLDFTLKILQQMGYDLERGRQDQTHHPFMTKFSLGDVRITTRVYEDSLDQALFSTIHEMGHALYEQGINLSYEGTPLANGTSSGLHESQSRLWENLVGRSRNFWQLLYPQLQEFFPTQLGYVSLEKFYQGINKVARTLIRTDADEITYNLHVMIRFDLELQLLEGRLSVKELPEAWNQRYHDDLGIVPNSDSEGVLQDVHWYGGMIGGMFQGYTLGNLISAQIFASALKKHPEITQQIAGGNFSTLHHWLKEQIYQHGRKYNAPELIERVTGSPLSIDPFISYIKNKYGELYKL